MFAVKNIHRAFSPFCLLSILLKLTILDDLGEKYSSEKPKVLKLHAILSSYCQEVPNFLFPTCLSLSCFFSIRLFQSCTLPLFMAFFFPIKLDQKFYQFSIILAKYDISSNQIDNRPHYILLKSNMNFILKPHWQGIVASVPATLEVKMGRIA